MKTDSASSGALVAQPGRSLPALTYVRAITLAVLAAGLVGAVGYGAALSMASNPAAIANPIIVIVLVFAVGAVSVWMCRLARWPSIGFALAVSAALLACYVAGSFAGLGDAANTGPWQAWRDRWSNGVSLLPNRWKLTGWWGWAAMLSEFGIIALSLLFTTTAECDRPYCHECDSWARKGVWKFEVASPPKATLMELKNTKRVSPLTALSAGGGEGKMRGEVGTCVCGKVGTFALTWMPPASDDRSIKEEIVEDLRLSPETLTQVFEWGERLQPSLAGQRPALQVEAEPVISLDAVPVPPDGVWHGEDHFGWSGTNLGVVDCHGNAYTNAMRKRLSKGDWRAAEEAMRAQRNADDLAFVAHAAATWSSDQEFFTAWVEERSDSSAYLLTRGIWTTLQAWKLRGTGFTINNPQEMVETSMKAMSLLRQAAERASKDPTAWAWMLQTAKTLPAQQSELDEVFQQLIARAPRHRMGHVAMLDWTMEKWKGNEGKMLSFARESAAKAGAGSPLGVLVAIAHIEAAWSRERNKTMNAQEYLLDKAVARELREVHDRTFHAGVFKPCMDTPLVRSYFAYALWKCDERDAAAEHLRLLSPKLYHGPFSPSLVVATKDSIAAARRECGVRDDV